MLSTHTAVCSSLCACLHNFVITSLTAYSSVCSPACLLIQHFVHLVLPALLSSPSYPPRRVTKRCHLSWLTNSPLVYEPKCGGGKGRKVSANEYSCAQIRAQINFRDLTRYLTYAVHSHSCMLIYLPVSTPLLFTNLPVFKCSPNLDA
jgi:hypothetical protein